MTEAVIFDASGSPLIRLRSPGRPLDPQEAEVLLAGLARLLDDDRRHVVIAVGGPPDLPAPYGGAFARWFKHERVRLGRLCAGMAIVVPDEEARAAWAPRLDQAVSAQAYPYPVTLVASEEEATRWAEAQLGGASAAS